MITPSARPTAPGPVGATPAQDISWYALRMLQPRYLPPSSAAAAAHTILLPCLCVSAAHVQEYQELVAQFKRQEQQLYQFCEEKVTLAHHAADLIQQHQKELESVSLFAGGNSSIVRLNPCAGVG